jgi:hypothetical protein
MKREKKTRQKASKVLTANAIILKDDSGNTRMVLQASDEADNSRINIFGKNGESLCLTVDEDSTCMLGIEHKDGRIKCSMSVGPDGESHIKLCDQHGNPMILLSSGLCKNPEIKMYRNGLLSALELGDYSPPQAPPGTMPTPHRTR